VAASKSSATVRVDWFTAEAFDRAIGLTDDNSVRAFLLERRDR
jgi:predicted RNA polymerase sigma factor